MLWFYMEMSTADNQPPFPDQNSQLVDVTHHGYWKYEVWNIFTFYLNSNIQNFFTSHGGYLLNTTL